MPAFKQIPDFHQTRLPSNSRLKDDTRAAFGDIPKRFHIPQGRGFHFELEGLPGGGVEELGQGLANLVHGGAAEAAAEQFQPGAAQGCGG
jgi:hypothetical protein